MNDAFVEEVATAFRERFSELQPYAKMAKQNGELEFSVELPEVGKSGRLHGTLNFHVSKFGVSVGMDGYNTFHTIGANSHLLEKMVWKPDSQKRKALEEFAGLYTDKIAVVEIWEREDWNEFKRSSENPSTLYFADSDKAQSMKRRWPGLPLRIRSWRGTKDEDIIPEPEA